MDIYSTGGIVAAITYGISSGIKKYIPPRFMPLVPLIATPLVGVIYASITHQMSVVDALKMGIMAGGTAIAAHETIDHTIIGKDSKKS